MKNGDHVAGTALLAMAATVALAAPAAAQISDPRPTPPKTPLEQRGDGYVPSPRAVHPRSPGMVAQQGGFVSVQVNVDANGDNIVGDAANEPSICVDPGNSLRAAIGWRQFDTTSSNFRQAGWGYTRDGGRSWTFPGVIEPGVFRSDPVLDTDGDGNFFYNSLTVDGGDFLCHVFRSEDGGRTWDGGVFAQGGDKQWMAIDRTNGVGRGNIYANWTRFYSICEGQFTRSVDAGSTFFDCLEVTGMPFWGTMTVGPDGSLYVVGAGFVVVKSTTLQDAGLPPAFDFDAAVNLGGDVVFSEGPNPAGLLGQAWIGVDHSDGPLAGNVYILASIDPPGDDPLDVHFARSEDGGLTWSDPVRVNDVRDGWQWFGTMAVAPNGRIDVIWNDTRNDPGGFDSEPHYASSSDGGVTWTANVAVGPAFDPHLGWPEQNKLGDYYDIVSDKVGADVAYAATYNGEQDVYYLRIGQHDCNDNGVGDTADIAAGTSRDDNGNGIPDECECPADIDDSLDVGFDDLTLLLAAWGPCGVCPEDIDGNGEVDFQDLLLLLAAWGPCP
jgi:hypothetical protein